MQTDDARTPSPRRPQSELAASAIALAKGIDWEKFFRDYDSGALARRRDEILVDWERGGCLDDAASPPSLDDASSNGARYTGLFTGLMTPARSGIAPAPGRLVPPRLPPRPGSAAARPTVEDPVPFPDLDMLVAWCMRVKARVAHA